MSMSNSSENNLLKLLFQNTAWANVGDASGLQPSGSAGSFYISLHTADPGEAGDQTTYEATYTGYGRVAVARSAAGFSITDNTVSNAATIQFGECSGGSSAVTHFAVGRASSSTGEIIYSGSLSATRNISSGITPLFNIGALQGVVD